MASRVQVIHDYSFDSDTPRPRRQVRFQTQDPIVLPRLSVWSTGAGLITVALAIGAIVVGSAYSAFHSDGPAMAETPAISLERDWQPLSANARAAVTNLLSGPALAVPSVATPTNHANIEIGTDTPNPTTRPPDAIAPRNAGPETPAPVDDPENPYR